MNKTFLRLQYPVIGIKWIFAAGIKVNKTFLKLCQKESREAVCDDCAKF
jgi:hypothetical protein